MKRLSSLTIKTILFLAFCIMAALALPESAYAGNGTFKNGKFNFCVSVRFNATPAQLMQIQMAFQDASQILADATDGQHQFGTVTIVNNSGASQSAEVWVNQGPGCAYATYGKYGVRGEHIMLYTQSSLAPRCPHGLFDAGVNAVKFTVAHEMAHHAYGVLDEYINTKYGFGECAPRPDTTLNFCLMDDYFTRGGGFALKEFCVASNHDPNMDTAQEMSNHKSCWETIASHPKRGAVAPLGLPIDIPPGLHTVNFQNIAGGLRIMLVIDRSGSMGVEQRLEFAKRGANLFADFARTGDSLGVISFDCAVATDFPLTTITGSDTRSAVKNSINAITLGGSTNIGDGLQAALSQLTSQPDRACSELIVLLSDGDHNCGTPPESVISAIQDAGVTVLTVGVGSGISASGQASLQNIASQTGGRYFSIANSFDLVGVFLRLVMESRIKSNGLLVDAPTSIMSGQTKEFPVPVETAAESATFAVAIANSNDQVTLSLRSPSGNVITTKNVDGKQIKFTTGPNSRVFEILAPEPGVWTVVVTAGTIQTGTLEILAFAEHDGVRLNVSVNKDSLTAPEAVEIQATPLFNGENVVGAVVNGKALRPDGSQVNITLFDDGLPEHRDAVADDGIYSSLFNNYSTDGIYTFELTVTNVNGTQYPGETFNTGVLPVPAPVPPFTRSAGITASITGTSQIQADLSLSKTVSSASVLTGRNVTYTITVTNNGPAEATDIVITDNLSSGLTFVSCNTTGGGVCGGSGNNRTATFASIPLHASVTVTITATVNPSAAVFGTLSNTASVGASTSDLNAVNNAATVSIAVFDLGVEDDINSSSVALFNSFTGSYRFCRSCFGNPITGTGIVRRKGSTYAIEDFSPTRRVLGKIDLSTNIGTASVQLLPGPICALTDRNMGNSNGSCQ
jgi:uncharacterized repeat protein (TIGR01451 family)